MDSRRGTRSLGLVFAAVLLLGAGAARADKASDGSKKAAAKKQETAEKAAPAKAAERAQPKPQEVPEPPVVERKIDPLDAALMQAMATTSLPAKPKKAQSPAERRARLRAKKTGGLKGLGKLARGAKKLRLDGRRGAQVPEADHVVRMGLQPLPINTVRAIIKKNAHKLQYCHERLAARGLASGGEVSVTFMVEPKGYVSNVKVVAGGEGARELERCMKQRIQKWKFPAADAPTPVSYPFVLEVAGSAIEN